MCDAGTIVHQSRFSLSRFNKFGASPSLLVLLADFNRKVPEKFVKAWIRKAKEGKGVYLISLLERLAGRTADWAVEEQIQMLEEEIQRLASPEAQIMEGKEQPQAK